MLIAAITIIAIVSSCSAGKPDDAPTSTTQPSATARPTVTQIPTATNTPEPTPTPQATATPSPTPTATPTPQPPDSYVQEMTKLFTEKGIDLSTLFVKSVGAAQWPTASLGCPDSGTYYEISDAPYTGIIYILSDGTRSWEYHANEDDSFVVRCSEIEPTSGSLTNIALAEDLRLTRSATLMRRDFSTDTFEVRRELTAEDAGRVANILNQDVALVPADTCTTIFRIDFVTQTGTAEIEFICQDDYKAFDVYWNGLHGNAPVFGYIIGPYLTGNPIPTLPTATP